MSLAERNKIIPQMAEYDRIGSRWVPYLMNFHNPSQRFPSVSTDEHGFRTTLGPDGKTVLTYAKFLNSHVHASRGVLLGSSTAFGIGATHDRYTIPSVLNRRTRTSWFNFGGRTFNSTQELLLFLLYLPRNISKLVVFSGINNLTLSYLAGNTSSIYNSFFYQSVFERAMQFPTDEFIGIRRSFRRLLKEMKHRVRPRTGRDARRDIDLQYESILQCFRRDMEILYGVGEACGFEIYYAFQPIATWIDKKLTVEEATIFEILDKMPMDWKVLAEYIRTKGHRYIGDVRKICEDCRITFHDMNTNESFREKEWLFVDRVHLTDRGYALAAEIMESEFDL